MDDIVASAKAGLESCVTTGDIRRLSAGLFREIGDKSAENVFRVCNELLEPQDWAMGVIAFDFAFRVRKQYSDDTFSLFEGWLERYVRGWGDCDDFCTHAFGELILQRPYLFPKIIPWTSRGEFWMRRASAVILIPAIYHGEYGSFDALGIADVLIRDEHPLVLKGCGWMLKVLSTKKPQLVSDYLAANCKDIPRVAFRYAIQKMDKEQKEYLMSL